MSWSRPAAVVAVAGLLLAGCGFQPLYGPTGETAAARGADMADALAAVEIANIPERNGQKLRNALIDRLHPGGAVASRFRLEVNYAANEAKLAVAKDASVERYQLSFRANYRLADKTDGKVLLNGVSRTNLVFDALDEQYALLVNRENSFDRAISEVSDDIALRVAAALRRAPPPGGADKSAP